MENHRFGVDEVPLRVGRIIKVRVGHLYLHVADADNVVHELGVIDDTRTATLRNGLRHEDALRQRDLIGRIQTGVVLTMQRVVAVVIDIGGYLRHIEMGVELLVIGVVLPFVLLDLQIDRFGVVLAIRRGRATLEDTARLDECNER